VIRWFAFFLAALQLFHPGLAFRQPQAASPVVFTNTEPIVNFGADVLFQTAIDSAQSLEKVFIYVKPQGEDAAFYPMTLSPNGEASYKLELDRKPLRAFSQVSYYYRATLATGEDVVSENYNLEYKDKRFAWKELDNPNFQVYWYGRDVDFGQSALNIAQSGLEAAARLVPASPAVPIRVYIYASTNDLQSTRLGAQPWVAGHASPDLHLVMVSIPSGPSQSLELERQLPHEITHILQFDAFGEQAKDLPIWLLEGTASVAELYPNADYASVLQSAVQQNQLLPIESLCAEFPRDASSAFLAYAQSQSFVNFLYHKYGADRLQSLYDQYHNGLGCKQGVETVYGVALSELEYRWRLEELRVNPAALIAQNLLPYLVLLFVVLGMASLAILVTSRRRKASTHA
jgi:hypothetical protein